MKRIITSFFLLILTIPGFPQVGNEWIHYDQRYFKIAVAKDGLYRLDYNKLLEAGLPASVDPATFQLFHRGVEQAIHVEGESDGQFNPSDYIEFYGKRNDGTLDTELYTSPSAQPHTLYNLYSDTTSYFLTYGAAEGKRMAVFSGSGSGLTPESFYWDEKLLILSSQYSSGVDYGDIQKSVFDEGEGWTGSLILQNQTKTYALEGISNSVTTADPSIEILLTGRGGMNHAVEIYAGARLLASLNFSAYQSYTHIQSLQWSDIGNDGKLSVGVKVIGVNGQPDRISVGYIRLRYPRQPDMNAAAEKFFTLAENPSGKSYIEIANPPAGARLFDITDPAAVISIGAAQTTTLNAVVSSTQTARNILAVSDAMIPVVKPVSFQHIDPAGYNFIIITHPLLRKPASGYTDPVKAYAEYRALPQGGGYNTLVVNIDQLYDQFNYGETSPLAVFHFMKFLSTVNVPDYLFLVGKGMDINYDYHRKPESFVTYKDLVPSAGYPASDMLYTAGLSGIPNVAAVSTGRLSAIGPQDVAAYLDKVKETEALPFNDLRRKNILHLSGGINEGEPQLFRSYLEGFAEVAKSFYLGGHVKAIAKQSTDIEVINVAEEVNKGLDLITFFGHSAPTSTDFDIGFVTDPVMGYDNQGKYPAILMNGCSAGSFFLNEAIFGENWINTPDRGAIAIIAHSYFGFAYSLRMYSSLFYEIAYGDPVFLNKGLGDVQREIAKRFLEATPASPGSVTQVQEMVLLGDPAVKLFGASKPDYEINEDNIYVSAPEGELITALTDSFQLNIVVRNFGKAVDQKLKVEVTRKLSDQSILVYDSLFNGVLYSDTISFVIPGKIENGSGNNIFSVTVDPGNTIEELDEENNTASIEYFIPANGTENLYPDPYAIVHTQQVNLSFQHTDLLSGETEFLVELDTTDTFNSGFKQQFLVSGKVIATQPVNLLGKDTLAYYWRTKLAHPANGDSAVWITSSFTYIKNGPEGWAQVHFPQYLSDASAGLVKDPELRRMSFEETKIDIALKTFGAAAGKPADSVSFRINDAEYNIYSDAGGAFGCRNNTINFVAFDKKTSQPYAGIYFTWYDILNNYGGRRLICGREPYVINSFKPDELAPGNNADIIQYVDNIAAGDSVVVFNIGDADYEDWPEAAKIKLGEIGISADQIDQLQPGEPVVIFGRKGTEPGTAKVYRAATAPVSEQSLTVNRTMTGRFTEGVMTSAAIGPAKHWERFITRYTEAEASDEIFFDITGITPGGKEEVLKTGLTGNEDLSDIDAVAYPYLKISYKPSDHTFVTAAQLHHWMVTFEPVPEGVVLYDGSKEPETLQEGAVWSGIYRFVNISDKFFDDSLEVQYKITNPSTFVSTERMMRIDQPLPGDTTLFTVPFSTLSQRGLNDVEVFVNPHILSEKSYDNNLLVLHHKLNVLTDGEAPVLDVTADGRHLISDEFVSSHPAFRIMLWDNNPYLPRKDTTGIHIYLAHPCVEEDCTLLPVYFSRNDMSWKEETDTSEFTINFLPHLSEGTYRLRVEAGDVSGNSSGAEPYEISFRVTDLAEVLVQYPYPNPFSYKTNFEFVVTGDAVPSQFRLQILSIEGKVVQEFSGINGWHTGINSVEWQGLDAENNPLPDGIYFYRMTLQLDGHPIASAGKIILSR